MLRPILVLLILLSVVQIAISQKDTNSYFKKATPAVKEYLRLKNAEDSIDVFVVSGDTGAIQNAGGRLLTHYAAANTYLVRIKVKNTEVLFRSKEVKFVDVYIPPKEELTTGSLDIATNYANYAHRVYPDIKGDSILVSIKENKPDTSDLDYIGRYVPTAMASPVVTSHASIMATTIAGAGTTSPYAQGVADRSLVTSSDFASLLPDPDALFQRFGITVQNHSYGTALQNYYGAEAAAYDVSAINNPTLLHVFSSGNAGGNTPTEGSYAGISGLANLTGNFKMAKNAITVGAIDSFYNISPLSSKGPAYDGRVKPELVAFGEDGSSGAAAMVSGSAALVQQAYKASHHQFPSSALIKAVLLNAADDVGPAQIDYLSGYGSLNTYKAVQTIRENRTIEDVLSGNASKSFTISVPQNVALLKITLAWADPAATVNAPRALVNNLDVVVRSATTGEEWMPWVLNPAGTRTALMQGAKRGRDTLNNVEQVTIPTPAAGTYTIDIRSGHLATPTQSFAVAYQVDTLNRFQWTFPTALDQVEAGRANILRWLTSASGSATIEYATNGSAWQPVATIPDASINFYKWNAPDTFSTAVLRMRLPFAESLSDTFVISRATDLKVGFNCADSFLLFWNALPVDQYQLYELGEKYLQPFRTTTDTFTLVNKQQSNSLYYSIAPIVRGRPGLRSFILNYTAQGTECFFKSFYLQFQDAVSASFFASLGSLFNVASLSLQKLQNGQFTTIRTLTSPATTSFTLEDSALSRGVNTYRLQITLTSGQTIHSDIVSLYHFPDADVIVYPNPARQEEPINIITSLGGRVALQIYNESGMLVQQMQLNLLSQQIPPFRLPKGIYFIRTITDEGKINTQKLIVL